MMTRKQMHRAVSAALVAILATLLLSLGPASPAAADPQPGAPPPGSSAAEAQRGVCDRVEKVDAGALPVNRWAAGTDQFHDRLGTKAWNDVAEKMQRRGVMSLMFSIGNFMWVSTTGMVESAVNFCILDRVGGTVDAAAHKIGESIMDSGIVAAFVVFSLVVYILRLSRGAGGSRDTSMLFQKLLIVALFGLMLAGAQASTGGTGADSPDYDPGFGSPGWFVTTIDDLVSASANTVVSNVADETTAVQGAEEGWDGKYAGQDGVLGCAPYVNAMKDLYKERYTNDAGYMSASAATPLMLSSMWEKSGLRMWQKAQFGTRNYYGHFSYCRMLEYNARSPLTATGEGDDDVTVMAIMQRVAKNAGRPWPMPVNQGGLGEDGEPSYVVDIKSDAVGGQFLAWRYSGSKKYRDREWVGWAACARPGTSGGGNDDGRWLVHKDGGASDEALARDCKALFEQPDWDGTKDEGSAGGDDGSGFDWDDSDDDVSQTSTSSAAEAP